MQIYFSGSIRGGRSFKEIYNQLISHLKNYGIVLTEHIGDVNLTESGESISDKHIFDRDMKFLIDSDILIAEVSTPSLGVGYEIALAEKIGKKILCLHKFEEGKKISVVISGNTKLNVKSYNDINEAKKIIDEFINNNGKR